MTRKPETRPKVDKGGQLYPSYPLKMVHPCGSQSETLFQGPPVSGYLVNVQPPAWNTSALQAKKVHEEAGNRMRNQTGGRTCWGTQSVHGKLCLYIANYVCALLKS